MNELRAIPGGGEAEPPERYITRKELAAIMGVSVRTIDNFVARGMPSETWGIRSRRFLASRSIAWAHTQGFQRTAA